MHSSKAHLGHRELLVQLHVRFGRRAPTLARIAAAAAGDDIFPDRLAVLRLGNDMVNRGFLEGERSLAVTAFAVVTLP